MLFVDFVYNSKTGKAVTGEHYLKRGFMPSVEDIRTFLQITGQGPHEEVATLQIKQYEEGEISFEASEGEVILDDDGIGALMTFVSMLHSKAQKKAMVSGEYEGPRRR